VKSDRLNENLEIIFICKVDGDRCPLTIGLSQLAIHVKLIRCEEKWFWHKKFPRDFIALAERDPQCAVLGCSADFDVVSRLHVSRIVIVLSIENRYRAPAFDIDWRFFRVFSGEILNVDG
jgi:hypothetical protein